MKSKRTKIMIASVLIMVAVWGFIAVKEGSDMFTNWGLDFFIFIFIIITGIIAFVIALKKDKDEKEGFPAEDELSNLVKYKSGYYAYLSSMYMWLFIFIFKSKFPDTETMLGGGILLSVLIFYISKIIVKRELNEKQD